MMTAAHARGPWLAPWRRLLWSLALLAALPGGAAVAQDAGRYPDHPVRLIVPFGPGSGGDFLARLVGARLGQVLGQAIVVENRPGASGNLAMELAARAAPDGYTLVLGNAGTNTVNPSLYRNLGFDPLDSFVPISKLTTVPSVIVAGPSSPVRTLPELIELARREPAKLDYATIGLGLSSHLAMVEFSTRAGIELTPIPYGAGGVLKAVLAGEVPLAISAVEVVRKNVEAGRLRALAVTSERRVPSLPDTPTVAEQGFPGFDMQSWYGILAPHGTPPRIVDRLNAELVRIVHEPDIARQIANAGQQVVGNTSDEFAADIRDGLARGRRLVDALGIHVD
ncbi:MAG: Bug family tripartite tricarboxylate transporter substrate binding protein [Candidatus Levyibacteriota bacterium]